jgi:hypothetical protein
MQICEDYISKRWCWCLLLGVFQFVSAWWTCNKKGVWYCARLAF